MNAKNFEKLLVNLGACSNGKAWARGKTLKKTWETLERADWMMWLLGKMADKPGWPTRKTVISLACDCAATALSIWEKRYPDDTRPHEAIQAARDYVKGKITLAELKEKRSSAAAAYAAADAAYAAAAAAYDADAAAYAAAAAAAYDDAAAAYAAAAAAYDADAAAYAAAAAAAYDDAAAAYDAAADAYDAAADAYDAAADAAYADARKNAHVKMCEIIRKRIPKVG
jgi:hypothetical protein